jgi:hypothetical protein
VLDEGASELLGLLAGAVGDFLEAIAQCFGAHRDDGLIVPATVPGTRLGRMESDSVKFNAEAIRLVVVVKEPYAIRAVALCLASRSRQAMGPLYVRDPAVL